MALAVVAGLWLLVFVPSWFKRSQERERGIYSPRPKASKSKRGMPARRPSTDNFLSLAREYAETQEPVSAVEDERAWERTVLPAPRTLQGTLEVPEIAEVLSFDDAHKAVAARKLDQRELDEILRRRRANG